MTAIDMNAWTTIVSIAAAIVTVIAFAASILFFISGSQLQRNAQDALTRIEALAQSINERTGRQFSRLVDVVAGAKEEVSEGIEPGSPASERIEEVFTELRQEIQDIAARQVLSNPPMTSSAGRERKRIRPSSVEPQRFKAWLEKERAAEQARNVEVQKVLDTMQDVGPLTPTELNQLSPFSIQELEDAGLIVFRNDGRWHLA